MRDRETELVFGAIEAGPLAIARLNSASIAQSELARLMSNKEFGRGSVIAAEIKGGPEHALSYGTWKSGTVAGDGCEVPISREFKFQDALNPFVVFVTVDQCFHPEEEQIVSRDVGLACVIIGLISVGLVLLAIWPAAISVRRAEAALESQDAELVEHIPLASIYALTEKALKVTQLEKKAALSSLAAQVAHDIRSPLSALNSVANQLTSLEMGTLRGDDVARSRKTCAV